MEESTGPFRAARQATRVSVQSSTQVVSQTADIPDVSKVLRNLSEDSSQCGPTASTTIHNDGGVKSASLAQRVYPEEEILDSGRAYTSQEVKDFLEKPVLLDQILLTGSMVATQVVGTYKIDKTVLFDNQPVWRNKVAGNMCIRGNVHLRIQVNANPFQQGRLILCFEPMKQVSAQVYNRLSHLRSITQLPHVQYDICMDSEAELVIPYVTLGTHYNLVNGENPWGVANIIIYSPLNGGTGSNTAEMTVWAHMTEVEVCTPALVYNQSADQPRRSRKPVGTVRRRNAVSEKEDNNMGPISKMLGAVGSVAKTVGQIPTLSGVAGTVEWAARTGRDVASAFGWSKPLTSAPNMRMNPTANMYQQNATGVDNAYNLGLIHDNKVAPFPALGGTDVDEMSLDYLKQVQAYNATVVWNTTAAAGDQLYLFEAFPNLYNGSTSAGITTVDTHPLGGLSDLFYFYRGSIIVTFKFVKTCFHSGRLAISFNPGFGARTGNSPGIPVDFTLAQSVYLNRDIIDLKDSHEFEFAIPWTSTVPYLPVNQPFGRLKVHVVNPLRQPDTCASTIDMIVEVRGGPDFEFMRPKPFTWFPGTLINPSPLMALKQEESFDLVEEVTEQSGDVPMLSKPLGNSTIDTLGQRTAEVCVGEQIRSLKQLLMRAVCMQDDHVLSDTNVPRWPYNAALIFRPFATSARTVTTPMTSLVFWDYYSLFASLFAFTRGGVIWRFVPTAVNASDRRLYRVVLNRNVSTTSLTPATDDVGAGNSSIFEYEFTNQIAVYVPQYKDTMGRFNFPCTTNLNATIPYADFSTLNVFMENTLGADFNGTSWRSGADDTHMSYFLGWPRMYYGAA